jgi:hypothetical protein
MEDCPVINRKGKNLGLFRRPPNGTIATSTIAVEKKFTEEFISFTLNCGIT